MTDIFPINYFKTIISPIKTFLNRKYLKIWQMILLFFFLTAVMMLPISISIGQIDQINLQDFVPLAMETVDDAFIQQLQNFSTENHQLQIDEEQLTTDTSDRVAGFVADQTRANELLTDKGGIILTNEGFVIQEPENPTLSMEYVADSQLTTVTDQQSFMNELSRQWFEGNRFGIILTNLINVWILMFLSFIFLVVGSSLFLSLMRFSNSFDINTFREAFTICLNAIGLPTFIAVIVGLFTADPTAMLMAQGLLFVLMLLWSYWKTHFNDIYTEHSINGTEIEEEDDFLIEE